MTELNAVQEAQRLRKLEEGLNDSFDVEVSAELQE